MSLAITSSDLLSLFVFTTGSILSPLFFVIYINNLSNHIVSTAKQLAANDILLFIAHSPKTLADELNSDLKANLKGYS